MTAITLPPDLLAWAHAEVAAGRAESVEALVAKGLRGYRLGIDTFRKSLDDARLEADRDGWIPGDAFMRDLESILQWYRENLGARAALKVAQTVQSRLTAMQNGADQRRRAVAGRIALLQSCCA
jgi:hypothetical protein